MAERSSAGDRGRLQAAYARRPHGVRGELRVEPLGRDASLFAAGLRLQAEGSDRWLTVESARPLAGGDVSLRFEEVSSRDQADALRGAHLWIDESDARPLAEGEWFVDQLVGLRATTPDGAPLGEVVDVESYAGHDVLVIDRAGGVRRFPMVSAFVERVDAQRGVIVIRPWDEEEVA